MSFEIFPMQSKMRWWLAGALLVCLTAVVGFAVGPSWWAERCVLTSEQSNDYGAINQGQLKQLATQAVAEMNEKLPGGAGVTLDDLIASWHQPAAVEVVRNDFAPVTHGQLKALAKLFYTRLVEESYSGPPLSPGQSLPWTDSTADDLNYVMANIGQAKFIFSFNLIAYTVSDPDADSDGDGLMNWEEVLFGTNPLMADSDGDGISDGLEIALGLNPLAMDPLAITGLKLLLTTDAGVTLDSEGGVESWTDQSPNGFVANAPEDLLSHPSIAFDPVTGAKVIRFEDSGDRLTLPDVMGAATSGEIFIVARLKNFDHWYNGLAQFGNDDGVVYSQDDGGMMWEDFGTYPGGVFLGPGTPVLTQTHIYNASVTEAGLSTVRFNGVTIHTRTASAVEFKTEPLIGTDIYDEFFNGDIAAVIVYDRVLSQPERSAVEVWLRTRYIDNLGGAAPAVPSNILAEGISPTQMSLSWAGDSSADYTISRKSGDGDYSVVAMVSSSLAYVDHDLNANTDYTYRIKASVSGASSGYGEPVIGTTLVAGNDLPLSGLKMWLKSEVGAVGSGTGVGLWIDLSGAGNNAIQGDVNQQPEVVADQFNGHSVLRFSGGQLLSLPNFMAGAAAGEIIAVLKVADKNEAGYEDTNNKLWNFNQSGVGYNREESSDVLYGHYNTFGLGDVNTGADVPVAKVSACHIYDTASSSGLWSEYYNGSLYRTITGQPVVFGEEPDLGSHSFAGDFAEILVYDRVLTAAERRSVSAYLVAKYAPPGIVAPTTPVLTGVAATSSRVDLSWALELGADQDLVVTVERKAGGGDFTVVGTGSDPLTYVDSGLEAGHSYTYRIKLEGYAGATDYSNSLTVTTLSSEPPVAGLRLWLRSSAGLPASGPIAMWGDQSGLNNHATQSESGRRPQVVPDVFNGYPSVHFNRTSSTVMNLPNLMAGATGGEILAVLRRSNISPVVGLWAFGSSGGSRYPEGANGVKDDFARNTSAPYVGIPQASLQSAHLYNVGGKSGNWFMRFNGVLYQNGSNVVSFRSSPMIGDGEGCPFDGDIAEILVYDRYLTDIERGLVQDYFSSKYDVPVMDTIAPSTVTGLVSSSLTASAFSLSWSAAEGGADFYDIYFGTKLIGTTSDTHWDISGLPADMIFAVTIRARDVAGNASVASSVLSVHTLVIDTAAPSAPSDVAVAAATATRVDLAWTPSVDNAAVAGYQIYNGTVLLGEADASATAYAVTGLAPGITYSFRIRAYDAMDNFSAFSTTLAAQTLSDMTAPSAPSELTVSNVSSTSLDISWQPSADNVRVGFYEIYNNTDLIAKAPRGASTYVLNNLPPLAVLSLKIRAVDDSGNASDLSAALAVTTLADGEAPSKPDDLAAVSRTATQVLLVWGQAADNVGVTYYDVYKDGSLIDSVAAGAYAVPGLTPGATYQFTIRARDAAGNVSLPSDALTIATLAATTLTADDDNDGMTNEDEGIYGTNPLSPDSDENGVMDGYEWIPGFNGSGFEDENPARSAQTGLGYLHISILSPVNGGSVQ